MPSSHWARPYKSYAPHPIAHSCTLRYNLCPPVAHPIPTQALPRLLSALFPAPINMINLTSHNYSASAGHRAAPLVTGSRLAPAALPRTRLTQETRRRVEPVCAAEAGKASNTATDVSSTASAPARVEAEAAVSPRKEAQLTLEQYKEIYDRLIKVNNEVNRYNTALKKIMSGAPDEWEAIVATCRGDLQRGFFEHVQFLIAIAKAAKDDKEQQEGLVAMNTRLVALCANYDSIEVDQDALDAAAETYRDLLSSISSIEEADKKMAELAKQGKIDPAFLQITAKAYDAARDTKMTLEEAKWAYGAARDTEMTLEESKWAYGAARDTEMTLEESKWVAYKLYRNARDHFDREKSAEKRIIEERSRMLDEAVTPGPTRFTDTHDYMYSTPQRLYSVLHGTLEAYNDMQAQAGRALGASEMSTTPRKIIAMKELRDEIMTRYL
eukprot:gene27497-4806_t